MLPSDTFDSHVDRHDLSDLIRGDRRICGFDPSDSGLVVVAHSGITDDHRDVDVAWSAENVASAWTVGQN